MAAKKGAGKSIGDYRAKRDFAKTPEPTPGDEARRGDRAIYVVHRHDASRLHYDLRLEMEGVLRSWAVPKGFSYDPNDKHLAVRTEDHPLEYEHFDGVIPKGQYGAGSMTIWDRGWYEVVKAESAPEAVVSGEVKVLLYGRRLRGEWHLVKTKQGEDTWLLFKSRDRYAGKARDSALGVDLGSAPERKLPRPPRPMAVSGEAEPFSDPSWLFEMEFEGRRTLVSKRGDRVTFHGVGAKLESIANELRQARATDALFDGVLVKADEHERPSRALLDEALAAGGEGLVFYAFDLLHFDDFDLRPLPLVDRKGALRAVLQPGERALFVDHVPGNGASLLEAVAAAGLPGVVAKRADAPYAPGPSKVWKRVPAGEASARGAVSKALRGTGKRRRSERLKLSNLEKVYWPAEGFTKGDLITYYDAISPTLLPYLAERPVHMNRFPDGIEGKSFYQKDTKDQFPDWIEIEEVPSSSRDGDAVRYPVIQDRDSLLFLINLGSIDMHPWLSRRGSLLSPDFAVIDLDPKGAPFADVVRIAEVTGELLHDIGLRPLLKTSGSTGLHIYVPLVGGYTYDHARMFCEMVARVVARELKDIATVERVVGSREGKVYIDFLQNRRGQTLVPPYSVRPVRGATVSAPLAWGELGPTLKLADYTILTVPPRVEERGDLFAQALVDRQDLLPAIERLEDMWRASR
ncbi:MAG: non-homologous end-joining DNA ligase [Planctomycetota bacterium]